MIHGWVVRGDLSQPETVSEIQRALKLTIDYLNELMVWLFYNMIKNQKKNIYRNWPNIKNLMDINHYWFFW